MGKYIKRIAIGITTLIVLMALAIFIVLRYYEDEIGAFAIEELEKQITTEFHVDDVGLAFWKTFPNASVELSGIFVQENSVKGDTLLYAEQLFLKFNLWDIFSGNYRVDEVEVHDGNLQLHVDKDGKNNWEVWNTHENDSSHFEIQLEEIQLTETRVAYNDEPNQFSIDLLTVQTTGSGIFSSEIIDIELSLDALVDHIRSKGDVYLQKRMVSGDIALNADLEIDRYVFKPSQITCADFHFDIFGSFNEKGSGTLEFQIKSGNQSIEEALEVLPPAIAKKIMNYHLAGDFSATAEISRNKSEGPVMVKAEVNVENGSMRLKEQGVSLEDIETAFSYVRGGKQDRIQVNNFRCELDASTIQASGSVVGFETPQLNATLSAEAQLNDLRDFFDLNQIETCEGSLLVKADLNGTLRYVEADSSYNWRDILATGEASFEDASLKMKNSNRVFSDMQASLAFDKQDLKIQAFRGSVNGSDFAIDGNLRNVVPFLYDSQSRIYLEANLKSNIIDFTQLVEEANSTEAQSEYELLFPPTIDFKLNCAIDKFTFRKFEATDVSGVVVLNNGKLTVDPVKFKTAEGDLSAQLSLTPTGTSSYHMNCLANLRGIHVDKVFTEFENFGQSFIQAHHVKGTADATVQFKSVVTNALEIPSDKIECLVDLAISDGELNNLETLQEIAAYLKSNKWVAPFVDEDRFAERMRAIKFSKLENVIEVKNRVVTIPLMDIKSSAMDISARGSHTFDNHIDYAIGFNLRDLLVKKEKDWIEKDDGLGKSMYVSMKGTVDQPVFAIDRELAKEMRKEAMDAEKSNVKALLKEELGLFKKDDSVGKFKNETNDEEETIMSVEWDDGEQNSKPEPERKPVVKQNDNSAPKEKPTEKKKKTPKWLEEKE